MDPTEPIVAQKMVSEYVALLGKHARDKTGTPAWQQLSATGRLAGEIAKTLAQDTEGLRREFRQFLDGIPQSPHT